MITGIKRKGKKVTELQFLINITVSPRKNNTQFYPWNFHEFGKPFGNKRTQLQGTLIVKFGKQAKKKKK